MSTILYVSYGSNINPERFNVYISGGTITGANRIYSGCRDNTPAQKQVALSTSAHQLYFARNSSVWGEAPYAEVGSGQYGGLALIDNKGTQQPEIQVIDPRSTSLIELTKLDETLLAGYLITREQFNDVFAQENNQKVDGKIEIPDILFESLTNENNHIDLKGRFGDNAIILQSGKPLEIDVKGAYSTLLYLGHIKIDGENVIAVTFTSPFSYERGAYQTGINFALGNVPLSYMDKARQRLGEVIEELMPGEPTDRLTRLNPASRNYIDMIATGIVQLGNDENDWTYDNAIEYLLSKPPFCRYQIPQFADQVRNSLIR